MNRSQRRGCGARWLIAIILSLLVLSMPVAHAALLNLTYDANGNLVTGDGKYRAYNSKNQLVSIRDGNNASAAILQTYVHHPTQEKMLVKKTYWSNGTLKETVTYISDEFVRVVNTSGTYNTTYYFDANADLIAQKNSDGTITTLLNDIEGSANVATNTTGGVIERTTYEPYGEVIGGGDTTRFNYEGREDDPVSGDTDFRFRKYRPEWGIFTQPDDVIQDAYSPQILNPYAFEMNNPILLADASGHAVYVGFRNVDNSGGVGTHGYIIVDPDDPEKFPDGYNTAYTLGGQPNNGDLVLVRDQASDVNPEVDRGIYRVPTPDGMTDSDHIARILFAYLSYGEGGYADYDVLGGNDPNEGNSNTAVSSLLVAGGTPQSFINGLNPAGYNPGLDRTTPLIGSWSGSIMIGSIGESSVYVSSAGLVTKWNGGAGRGSANAYCSRSCTSSSSSRSSSSRSNSQSSSSKSWTSGAAKASGKASVKK